MFDSRITNFHQDKAPQARPGIIAHQGKVLWKCNVCFRYNPQGHHQCESCGMRNPMMFGVPQ